jgi:hypothetical protein
MDPMVALAVGCAGGGPDHFLEKCAPVLSISSFAQPRHAADAAMKLIAALPGYFSQNSCDLPSI